MVLADEVNPVNQLYRELSSRYKAGWTFHRFILGLRKFFGSQDLDDRTKDFQSLYHGLREVSLRLNDLDIPPVVERLDEARRSLEELIGSLDEQDRKIPPSLVRLFFQRVKTRDERILIELVRFYLEVQRGRDWQSERVDKVDYLLSRLGEAIADPKDGGGRERLNRVLGGISEYTSVPVSSDPRKVANRIKLIQAVRNEIQQVDTFEALTERDLVAHYRSLKHSLGVLLVETEILPMIVNTNLAVSARVNELTEKAQEKIFEDYERVSDLEKQGLLGRDLAESVSKLHDQVGSFKKQIKGGTLRIEAIAEIQGSVQDIFGRIALDETADLQEELAKSEVLTAEHVLHTGTERDLLGALFEDLVEALRETYRGSGKARGLDSRLLEYRLEPREIEAFARLSSGAECDASLEQLLLAASSLRRKIRLLVEKLHSVGVEASSGERKVALADAAQCLRLGDLYLRRFGHFLEMRLGDQEVPRIRELQISKMHLMREYSGLWLLVNDSLRQGTT